MATQEELNLKLVINTREAQHALEKIGTLADDHLESVRQEGLEAATAAQTSDVIAKLDEETSTAKQRLKELEDQLRSLQQSKGALYEDTFQSVKALKENSATAFYNQYGESATVERVTQQRLQENSAWQQIKESIKTAKAELAQYQALQSKDAGTLRSGLMAKEKQMLAAEARMAQIEQQQTREEQKQTVEKSAQLDKQKQLTDETRKATEQSNKSQSLLSRIWARLHPDMDKAAAATDRLGKRMVKLGLGMLGVRSLFSALRRATSAYLQDNQETANKLNSIWATLGNAIGPVIDWLADKVMGLLDMFSGLMKVLFGVNIAVKKATTATGSQAAATGDLADETQKANKQLAGFDEINKLTAETTSKSGSGSGGSGSGTSYEIVPTTWKPWDELKAAIESGDWVGVGRTLADKVNSAFATINWEDIGTRFGKGLDAVFKVFYGFLDQLDTMQIGEGLATAFNKTLENWDTWFLGADIALVPQRLYDLLYGATSKIDWWLLGDKIADGISGFFATLDLNSVFGTLFNLVTGLPTALVSLIVNLDYSAIAGALGKALGSGIKWTVELAKAIETLGENIVKAIKQYFDAHIKAAGGDIVKGLLNGILEGIKGIGTWIKTNIFDPFIKGFKTAFGIASPSRVMAEQGRYIIQGLYNGITEVWRTITSWVKTAVDGFVRVFKSAYTGITSAFNGLRTWFDSNVIRPITTLFKNIGTPLINAFKSPLQTIQSAFKTAYSTITSSWKGLSTWFKTGVITPLVNAFSGIKQSIGSIFQGAWDNVKRIWSGVKSFFSGVVKAVKDPWTGISAWFNSTFKAMHSHIDRFFGINGIKKTFQSVVEAIKAPFNGLSKWFSDIFGSAWKAVQNVFSAGGSIFSGIQDGISYTFKRIVNGLITGINSVVAVPFNAINSAIKKIRDAKILGYQPFSGLGTINVPKIPYLAQGGIVVRPTQAVIGERGREAVLPLENNTAWMDTLADKVAAKIRITGTTQTPINLDGREIAKITTNWQKRMNFAGGI